ncbi:glycosyltransferase [Georgenia alba]|uniref:Glycosyltransferase n=1 Tax=Georgenia alba TaxID=2233858 RepID=A0ABW2Q6C1_9MICO
MAVVVSHDRRDLLARTLDGLAAQDRPCDAVVVVDNASSDGSADLADAHPLAPEVVRLPRNTGGAGGFAAGTARAVRSHRADLVWLMDDDTVPTPSALAELLRARSRYAGRPALLASRAVWHDGRDHPMNTPRRRFGLARPFTGRAAAVGGVPIRSASFVSTLVDARAVREEGLPEAAYFIWNDDFEFTARLLRRRTGLFVPTSVVEHLTRTFGSTDADPGERFFYEVRNKLWMLRTSRALGPLDLALYGAATLRRWGRTVLRSADRPLLLRAGRRGFVAGLTSRPEPTTTALAGLGAVSDDVRAIQEAVHRD